MLSKRDCDIQVLQFIAAKGPNDVISCLDHYVTSLPKEIDKLHLFADNCFSQNKNRYLIAYLRCLVNTPRSHMNEVHLRFPIPGHS